MSNYYAPCLYRIDFVVIPSYIELPCLLTEKEVHHSMFELSLGKVASLKVH